MSYDAEAALREGLATQAERVAELRKTMETYRAFYVQFKGDYERANEIYGRMQKLARGHQNLAAQTQGAKP